MLRQVVQGVIRKITEQLSLSKEVNAFHDY
jgi:hypothetical protein